MTDDENSLELLYRSRDLLGRAVSDQEKRAKPPLDELHALGSVIVANLSQLGHLSSLLAQQVGRFEDEELQRAKLSDHPEDKLRVAGTYLSKLADQLAAAITDANRYWTAVESADLHTSSDLDSHE
jgi:hypothetical protein